MTKDDSNEALAVLACAIACTLAAEPASAHGFAGKRFFSATLATEDPFVADELSLPTISRRKTGAGGEPLTVETEVAVDFSKRITPDIGIGLGTRWMRLQPDGEAARRGFDNLAANIKYQFHKDDAHETILSVGVDWDIGGTGSERIDAESFSTFTPAFFFGKGFGDLDASLRYLRPLALTGSLGVGIPTRASTTSVDESGSAVTEMHPHTLKLGLALQYSLPYLQSFVKDVGLREPFNRFIPIIELSLEKPLDRGRGPTLGTVNPGLLIAAKYVQFGIEAVVPINHRSGHKTGMLMQLHFFLDDLFPASLGKPLLGR